jgi:hypothetical protein
MFLGISALVAWEGSHCDRQLELAYQTASNALHTHQKLLNRSKHAYMTFCGIVLAVEGALVGDA